MAQLFKHNRNRATTVEVDESGRFTARCRLVDTLMELSVSVSVTMPDLEIIDVSADIERFETKPGLDPGPVLEKLVGARIGSGLFKIIAGVVGDDPAMAEPAYMVEECCQGVILALTKGGLAQAPREPEDSAGFLTAMVNQNPRMAGRCIAFAPDSPFVTGAGEKGND